MSSARPDRRLEGMGGRIDLREEFPRSGGEWDKFPRRVGRRQSDQGRADGSRGKQDESVRQGIRRRKREDLTELSPDLGRKQRMLVWC